ncbi:MAG: tRNA adenosine(34) deaminase TadA [Selenomonadaceae bacterium]|uniref:tRNA adenosine(34) deaminase TadA n=1 Tax=Selenomonas bovis TaxID=416586 RepID=UPI0004E2386D|nr:tRNA adenosine(34) deaminase TadA [Selenomonas bovis]MBQ1621564.1 tRNA adenosine(34) deaminase TadA [Selenomonas sp.]MDY6273337.1 tRNA adenosine(34) deaminase TadA [Selenomonadaceae bacterium]MDY6299590.1 tRNA adenosine(34) deaminase TadA [Selenomonadaceae bacterium]
MKQEDAFYMRAALAEAAQAYALGEVPIGAVLVDEAGEIVARGHNLRERDHDATAHAEMIAIRAACERLGRWRLSGLTLYVTIEPCPMCAGAIVMSRVDRVVYGGTDYKAGACESLFNIPGHPAINHHPEVTAGVLAEECADIMKRFFRERRARKKAAQKNIDKSTCHD